MIVSHEHRFIFIHLPRTGGCSLTASLAAVCGPDDVITPVSRGSHVVEGRNCEGLKRHASAATIRAHVGEDVWNDYFKFTFERNPWDKVLSRYAYYKRSTGGFYRTFTGKEPSLRTYLALRVLKGYTTNLGRVRLPSYYACYTERGRLAVDFIGRLESREAHLAEIARRLGLALDTSIWTNKRSEAERVPYTEAFRPWMLRLIERAFAKDLALLRYEYGRPHPTTYIERGPDGEPVYREPAATPAAGGAATPAAAC